MIHSDGSLTCSHCPTERLPERQPVIWYAHHDNLPAWEQALIEKQMKYFEQGRIDRDQNGCKVSVTYCSSLSCFILTQHHFLDHNLFYYIYLTVLLVANGKINPLQHSTWDHRILHFMIGFDLSLFGLYSCMEWGTIFYLFLCLQLQVASVFEKSLTYWKMMTMRKLINHSLRLQMGRNLII